MYVKNENLLLILKIIIYKLYNFLKGSFFINFYKIYIIKYLVL